jgi:hypothetical protein
MRMGFINVVVVDNQWADEEYMEGIRDAAADDDIHDILAVRIARKMDQTRKGH